MKITEQEVFAAQENWGKAIVAIGEMARNGGDYQALTRQVVADLYAFDEREVLFKPTRASETPFRTKSIEAVSYFAGDGVIEEDLGFALQLWKDIRFENHNIIFDEHNKAYTMGHYYFYDAESHDELKVEYTMAFCRTKDGKVKLFLHHSSFPYKR